MIRVLALGLVPGDRRIVGSSDAALTILQGDGWAPAAAALDIALLAPRWWPTRPLTGLSSGHDSVVLFADDAANPDRATVARCARNRADPMLSDTAGHHWPGAIIAPGGAIERASGLAPFPLARAMQLAGLDAEPSTLCQDDIANKSFYELLGAGRMAGLIRLPVSNESARLEGRRARHNRCEIVEGVKAALDFAAAAAAGARGDLAC